MKVEKQTLDYLIKSYECDRNGTLRILTLMNILQDAADNHASNLGIGIEHCLANGLAWVGTGYHVKINRMPKWHEKIAVTTWPSDRTKLVATRDFRVTDEEGNDIVNAASLWVLINYEKKRPVSLDDNLPPYNVVEDRALASEFAKIPELDRVDCEKSFEVRYDDIDVNNHVNNAVYPLWATEGAPSELRLNHIPVELEVAFKKECLYGENITVYTQIDGLVTSHSIKADTDGRELAKVRILWK